MSKTSIRKVIEKTGTKMEMCATWDDTTDIIITGTDESVSVAMEAIKKITSGEQVTIIQFL